MAHLRTIGSASALPLADALAIIPSLPRALLSRLVTRAIERLDEMDSDPDLEADDHGEDNHDAECGTWPTDGAQWEAAKSAAVIGTV